MADEVVQENTLGDASITQRTEPAPPGAGQSWPDVHTHADADAQAAERSVVFPRNDLTVAQKQAILNGESIDEEV